MTIIAPDSFEENGVDLGIGPPEIVGASPTMRSLTEFARRVGPLQAPVVIIGETGTGKELIARLIHTTGRSGPFIPIDCASIPASLIERELFGHIPGAYTGAAKGSPGLFEACQDGTAFLDEITEVPLDLQVKLLRVLQDRQIRPIGSVTWRRVNFRVVAATNRDLLQEVNQGRFRSDLYYRLNVIDLRVPPLRERKEDIPNLAAHFLRLQNWDGNLTQEALTAMRSYHWPGNVRELENCIARLVALSSGRDIGAPELLAACPHLFSNHERVATAPMAHPEVRTLREINRQLILEALSQTGGHRLTAARLLGIGRTTLYRKLKTYGVAMGDYQVVRGTSQPYDANGDHRPV